MVVRDEYRDRVGLWGRWLRASLPAVLQLAYPSGWRLQYAATAGADYWAALSLDAEPDGWQDFATAGRFTAPCRQ
jgi:hypothetical protein